MKYLIFLACLAIALAGCAGQPSPQASPTATEIAQAPSPTPTPSTAQTPTPTPTATPVPTPTPTETLTPEPTATPKPTATPTPEPQVYVVVQQISTSASPGGEEDGYIIPGKRFVILQESDGWLHIHLAKGAIVWIQASETAYRPASAGECAVERCECYREIALYWNATDEESFSTLVPGTNKTFVVKERRDGRMLIKVTEPSGDTWEAWADDSPGAYGPVGAAPPTPTPETPPAAVCTEPHWPDRTPDRKTGYNISFGDYIQWIFPDTPYVKRYFRMSDGSVVWMRDVRIMAIDRQNQIITFKISDGSTRQRRFTPNTQVAMEAHEIYRGMPSSQARQWGGNFCDLEVGDVASILHPDEAESANPNPNLTDLLGMWIVQ